MDDNLFSLQYRTYQVRNGPSGRPLNFRLCDTRGLEESQGIEAQDVCYILDGHTPDKYVVSSRTSLFTFKKVYDNISLVVIVFRIKIDYYTHELNKR